MSKSNNKLDSKTKIYVLFSLAILIVLSVACFCIHAAYEQGVHDGRVDYENETVASLSELGTAISEKTEFISNAASVLKDVPTEIDNDGIDIYIDNLTKLNDSVNTDAVKTILSSYIVKWQSFKDTYTSENNDAITEAFNELKTEATNLAKEIREIYDSKIKDSTNSLTEE